LNLPRALVGAANFQDYQRQSSAFEDMALVRNIFNANITGEGEPERVLGALMGPDAFKTVGAKPRLGRVFMPEESQVGKDDVVILSDGLWKRRFGSDPEVIGKTLQLNASGLCSSMLVRRIRSQS
jgi:hypothetical protein